MRKKREMFLTIPWRDQQMQANWKLSEQNIIINPVFKLSGVSNKSLLNWGFIPGLLSPDDKIQSRHWIKKALITALSLQSQDCTQLQNITYKKSTNYNLILYFYNHSLINFKSFLCMNNDEKPLFYFKEKSAANWIWWLS